MAERYELRFSGAGGQGLITAGIILAEAASIIEGKHAVQSQSYGPEARGGASKSEVIISDAPIDYPKATIVDACLAMTQEAADKYANGIKKGGLLLIDSDTSFKTLLKVTSLSIAFQLCAWPKRTLVAKSSPTSLPSAQSSVSPVSLPERPEKKQCCVRSLRPLKT